MNVLCLLPGNRFLDGNRFLEDVSGSAPGREYGRFMGEGVSGSTPGRECRAQRETLNWDAVVSRLQAMHGVSWGLGKGLRVVLHSDKTTWPLSPHTGCGCPQKGTQPGARPLLSTEVNSRRDTYDTRSSWGLECLPIKRGTLISLGCHHSTDCRLEITACQLQLAPTPQHPPQ